ncbi:hypothetical protein ACQHIV_29315 [Kribbella sp. GL6]|uniref:hypothetical protein n=1 Tax=Kribbella sp. GL6 TaxID=3419765 RepID=UPI003D00F607
MNGSVVVDNQFTTPAAAGAEITDQSTLGQDVTLPAPLDPHLTFRDDKVAALFAERPTPSRTACGAVPRPATAPRHSRLSPTPQRSPRSPSGRRPACASASAAACSPATRSSCNSRTERSPSRPVLRQTSSS